MQFYVCFQSDTELRMIGGVSLHLKLVMVLDSELQQTVITWVDLLPNQSHEGQNTSQNGTQQS